MDGLLFRTLDRLPEPWGMVVAWVLYLGVIGIGWAVTWEVVKAVTVP